MNFRKLFFTISIIIYFLNNTFANNEIEKDSSNNKFGIALEHGTFEFHTRTFFMSTTNRGDLSDYYALATGGGLGYFSPEWKGFSVGLSGFFTFSLAQNNLDKRDPITGGVNRYELLLFDMNHPENKKDLDRMDELFIKYHKKNLVLHFGRQSVHSPLMNKQDNRMRPNIYSGISGIYKLNQSKFHLGLYHALAPRGTVEWYSIENSFGVYPFGRSVFGVPSDYKENISSNGIAVAGYELKKNNQHHQVWNYYADNVFNLTFAQSDLEKDFKNFKGVLGMQGFYQTAINDGGNEDQFKSYIHKDEWTYGLGGRLGVKNKKHFLSLNYLHISHEGRFLFPREWGREQFYISLPRERVEGNGGVNSLVLRHEYLFEKPNIKTVFGGGYSNTSSLNNYFLNKYGMPSYYHLAGIIDYRAKGYFEGLDIMLIVANKIAQNPEEVPDNYRINRVDLWNFNLVMDYRF